MRSNIPNHLLGTILCAVLGLAFSPAFAGDENRSEKIAVQRSTLSEMGIDFGAAELGRFTALGLSDAQKKEALSVVRGRKPKIEKLCVRMTSALKLKEESLAEKKAKERELGQIVGEFKNVQVEIISGLHALVTPEQMTKLESIKQREEQQKLKAKSDSTSDSTSSAIADAKAQSAG